MLKGYKTKICTTFVHIFTIADKSQLVLSYQACVDIKGSQSHTEQAQCIGDWKEGSTYYFAAVMNSSHVTRYNREDSFRYTYCKMCTNRID